MNECPHTHANSGRDVSSAPKDYLYAHKLRRFRGVSFEGSSAHPRTPPPPHARGEETIEVIGALMMEEKEMFMNSEKEKIFPYRG